MSKTGLLCTQQTLRLFLGRPCEVSTLWPAPRGSLTPLVLVGMGAARGMGLATRIEIRK